MHIISVKGLTAFALVLGNLTLTAALAQGAPSVGVVILPTVDATIASGPKARVAFGAESFLRVKAGAISNGTTYRGFLTFDVGAVSGRGLLEGAALELDVDGHSNPGLTLEVYGVKGGDTQLSEAEVTWSSIKANRNANHNPVDLTEAVKLASLTCAAGCKKLSLATPELLNFVNEQAGGRVSFILAARAGSSGDLHFYSKERPAGKPASLTLMASRSLVGLSPQADASVEHVGPWQGANFGTGSEIHVKRDPAKRLPREVKTGYLGFNLSSLNRGSSSFSFAGLEITPSKVPKTGQFELYGFEDVERNQPFGDLQITGANAPILGGSATKLATFDVARKGERISVSTPELLSFMNRQINNEHITFVVRSASADRVERSFFSKESESTVVDGYTVVSPNAPTLRLLGSAPTLLLENGRTQIKMTRAKANTLYYFRAASSSSIGNSAGESTLVRPVSADLGVLDRSGVITDGSGNATVTVQALAAGLAVLAQEMPLHASIGGQDAVFQDLIDSGVVQVGTRFYDGTVQGTRIDVDNILLEENMGGDIPPIISVIQVHTQNKSTVTRRDFSKWTRWYQEDGKTQIFRLFKGEQNVRGGELDEGTAGRIEAYTRAELPSDPGLDGWLTWEGVFTPIKPGGNNFQLMTGVHGWPLHIDTDNDGTMTVLHRGGEPRRELIATNLTGKNIGIRVITNGLKYIVYRKVLGVDNDFVFVTERENLRLKADSRKLSFRWGVYVGSKPGSVVPRDLLTLVTGVKISSGRPVVQSGSR